jgi:hypothetical protein
MIGMNPLSDGITPASFVATASRLYRLYLHPRQKMKDWHFSYNQHHHVVGARQIFRHQPVLAVIDIACNRGAGGGLRDTVV